MRACQQLMARRVGIAAVLLVSTAAKGHCGQSANPTASDPILGWRLATDRSKGESPTVVLSVAASNTIEAGGVKVRPVLSVRCREGQRDVAVYTEVAVQPYDGPGLAYGGSVIQYRRDDAGPVGQVWSLSNDEDSLAVRDDGLIVQLAMSTRFRFEFTPQHASAVVADFDVTGLTDHIERLTQACPSLEAEIAAANASMRGTPASDEPTQVYFEFQVERHVTLPPDNPVVPYPRLLRSANVEGEVLMQFIVDTTGHAEMGTFKVLKTTHDLFTNSVKATLPHITFIPAEVGGRRVRQVVQMPFHFTLARGGP